MRISGFWYTLKQGIKNIQNKMFSLASVGTMSACIFCSACFAVVANFKSIVAEVSQGTITVFLMMIYQKRKFMRWCKDRKAFQVSDIVSNRRERHGIV